MSLSGVIFDFDGVIANTEPIHFQVYQDVLANTPLKLDPDAYYARYLGYDDVGVFTALAKDQGVSLDQGELQQLLERKGKRFQEMVGNDSVLFPEAAACVERLAAAVPLGIASGALYHEIDAILTQAGLRRYFSVIVASDDIERSKPAPDAYARAVRLLRTELGSTSDGCFVAIEDSRWGIEAAQAAGIPCLAITHSYSAEQLYAADALVTSLADVDAALLENLCTRCDE